MIKVLVIDDDPSTRSLLRKLIGAVRGTEIAEATNGAEGLALANEIQPDLILLDMMMPVMDGIDFLKSRASIAKLSDIPVVMLTAVAEREQVIAAVGHGARDYIVKPFDSLKLRGKMASLLEEVASRADASSNAPQAAARRERPVVLVASENEEVRQLAVQALESNYEVLQVTDGARGLHTVAERHPDLLLLSTSIPLVPAKELVEKVKGNEETGTTHIGLLGPAEELENLGEDFTPLLVGTVQIPCSPDELRQSADRMLDRSP